MPIWPVRKSQARIPGDFKRQGEKDLFEKIKKDRAIQQVLLYLLLIALFGIENIFVVGKYDMYSPIDDFIPFIPVFVVPYFMWYLFIIAVGVYFLLKSKEDLRKTFLSINISMVLTLIIYLLFPSYQSLRPLSYGGDIFSQWVKFLQAGDSSSCVCPSLHVSVCITLFLGVASCVPLKRKAGMKILAFILTVFICSSTVLIKQHSIVDVEAGVLMSVLVYIYVYVIKNKAQNPK